MLRSPAWNEMEAQIERKVASLQATAQNIALHPDGADQRKLDTCRGTIAALRWMIGVPKHAERTLQQFLREHGIEDEFIVDDEGSNLGS